MKTANILSKSLVEIDALDTMYPCRMTGGLMSLGHAEAYGARASTYYLYVLSGRLAVQLPEAKEARPTRFELNADEFLAAPGPVFVNAQLDCAFFVVERLGFRGQLVAGRRETVGRLSYIDGCSDSMLVYPPRMGDPVLNHLHFPHGVVQTQHLHPSIRLGCVVAGSGTAFGPGWHTPLRLGDIFMLDEQEIHSFRTDEHETDGMDVVAFHPDSDWGPVDANHPMLNRTYIKHGGGAR